MTTRRTFIKGAGSLVLYFNVMPFDASAQQSSAAELPQSLAANRSLDTWLRLDADGVVTLSPGKCELGQGVQTALAQIAAEELDVDMGRIQVLTVDTGHSPDEAYTSGSRSIEHSGAAIRMAAAEVRAILVELAADELDTLPAKIAVRNGVFTIDGAMTPLDYWSVIAEKTLERHASGTVPVKDRDRYRVVGSSAERIDIPAKAFAENVYIHDMRLDGMLHARVVRTGNCEATLSLRADIDTVMDSPGVVKVVRDGSFLAVVAEREEQAVNAARQLAALCDWKHATLPFDESSVSEWLREAPAEVKVVAERGAVGSSGIARNVGRSYSRAFQAHASLSPSAAIAHRQGDRLTVWSHSQGVYPLRGAIAKIAGLDEQSVRCIHAQASGCYGHNGADDAACDAALIAMQVPGRPIRLQWSRADEFLGEPYGSAMTTEINAGIDDDGRIVDWNFDVWSGSHSTRPRGANGAGRFFAARQLAEPLAVPPVGNIPQPRGGGDRNAVPGYAFANHRVTKHLVPDVRLRVSAMRALGAFTNVFAIESFMDEIAHEQAEDPIDFRIRHLDDQRAIGVLNTLREQMSASQTGSLEAPAGVGIGMARYKNSGAYCAVAMHVVVNPDSGQIKLRHALCAVDVGLVINPDGVINQIEGGIIQASSWTVREQIRLDRDGAASKDWVSYPVLTFAEVPAVEVTLIDQPDELPLGAGEAAQGPTAAAIANAVARATGKRIRDLPLTPARVRQA
ncbi:MAG: molybdopterin-dependent oxidoreductase [Gammaproteobacteria bacterium]|nr:molybdopterin-dependent oxidoreductase [Gammaproteobacteria bacterium]MDH3428779.1 molybdopterin-dependent oxidoreductase [Gammaproteobacteria bacterium]MDH3434544.1 molybdopterin-dependent oxidoreductase [Gammaproteobacteria bacterium]